MDRESDLLFLILTSHGSQERSCGAGRQARGNPLTGASGRDARSRWGFATVVVVISACYSGVFIRPLATEDTLVITAADAEHSSFGCQDKVKWTYFGDAFFNTALRYTADLRSALSRHVP